MRAAGAGRTGRAGRGRRRWEPGELGGGGDDNAVEIVRAVLFLPAALALRLGTVSLIPRFGSGVRAGLAQGRAEVGEGGPERTWRTTLGKLGDRDLRGVRPGQG